MPDGLDLVGEVIDRDGTQVAVLIEGNAIRLEVGSSIVRFEQDEAEEFAQVFVSACWEAGRHG